MIESIKQVGALTPALARPIENSYELISGHRRLASCQALGIESMPVIIRKLNDDEAVIVMVDANLQRGIILPSKKAFAYKMKLNEKNIRAKLLDNLSRSGQYKLLVMKLAKIINKFSAISA